MLQILVFKLFSCFIKVKIALRGKIRSSERLKTYFRVKIPERKNKAVKSDLRGFLSFGWFLRGFERRKSALNRDKIGFHT